MNSRTDTHHHHIVPLSIYLGVGAALFVLTGVTVAISFIKLGGWNVAVALCLASLKASLVALFFMHLKYDNKIYMVIFLTSLVFLAIFIIFILFDTLTRDQLYIEKAEPIKKNAAMYDEVKPPIEDTTGGIDSTSDSLQLPAEIDTAGPADVR